MLLGNSLEMCFGNSLVCYLEIDQKCVLLGLLCPQYSAKTLLAAAAAAAKLLQSYPTLCDPIDGSLPGPPHPWDSPGKNTGVGCHFLLQLSSV